jgi:hypothetical protein
VHTGTLDLPGLFEPDLHIYVEGKVQWLTLPEGTKTLMGDMDRTKEWPKSSLVRFEACMKRWEVVERELGRRREEAKRFDGKEGGDDAGEKTPTNEKEEEGEVDDVEFERKQDEIERALEERLEKLCLKLDQEESKSKS